MLRRWAFGAVLVLLAAMAARGHAATLSLESTSIPGLTPKSAMVSHKLRLTGMIEAGDSDKLRKMVEKLRGTGPPAPGAPLATIELSSKGGDLYEGLKLGYLFREFDIATVVRKDDLCLSACALAFLGGTQSHAHQQVVPSRSLEIGGQVGFHNFYLTSPADLSASSKDAREGVVTGFTVARGGAAALVRYAVQMGIDPAFVARMMGQAPEAWEYIDTDEAFVTLRVCPVGLARRPTNPAAIAAAICNHATGDVGQATPMQARPMSAREMRRHLLEQVRNTSEASAGKGLLTAQLSAVLAARDDSLMETVYAGLRSAGVPLPDIQSANFEVTGYDLGGTPLECHVSFSRDNPAKFDVTLATPAGLVKAFQSPPEACPELFLYDSAEMLNPKR